MAGQKGNKRHANKTSYPNQKDRTVQPSIIMRVLKKALENTKYDSDILSWQDACESVDCRRTKLDYWCEKTAVFGIIKKEIYGLIAAKVNREALKGKYNPAASIWRMKQSGETDEKIIDNKSSDGSMTPIQGITFDKE